MRQLIHKMWNERRSNVAPVAGLFITFILMWYCMDIFYVSMNSLLKSSGYNIDHVYRVEMRANRTFSYEGMDMEQINEINRKNAERILSRLQNVNGVEAATLIMGTTPYTGNMFQAYALEQDTMLTEAKVIYTTKGYFDTFGVDADKEMLEHWGEIAPRYAAVTPELAQGVWGEVDVKGRLFKDFYSVQYSPTDEYREMNKFTVGSVIPSMRLEEFERFEPFVIAPMPLYMYMPSADFFIRVRSKVDSDHFVEDFMNEYRHELSQGPSYLNNVEALKQTRDTYNLSNGNTLVMRGVLSVMIFFLLNIFLGIGGIFWFRMQGRVKEIGVKKAMGATNVSIVLEVMAEVVYILLFAVLPAIVVCAFLAYNDIIITINDLMDNSIGRFGMAIVLTLVAFLIISIIAAAIPATRAMRILPIDALKEKE